MKRADQVPKIGSISLRSNTLSPLPGRLGHLVHALHLLPHIHRQTCTHTHAHTRTISRRIGYGARVVAEDDEDGADEELEREEEVAHSEEEDQAVGELPQVLVVVASRDDDVRTNDRKNAKDKVRSEQLNRDLACGPEIDRIRHNGRK